MFRAAESHNTFIGTKPRVSKSNDSALDASECSWFLYGLPIAEINPKGVNLGTILLFRGASDNVLWAMLGQSPDADFVTSKLTGVRSESNLESAARKLEDVGVKIEFKGWETQVQVMDRVHEAWHGMMKVEALLTFMKVQATTAELARLKADLAMLQAVCGKP
jgi:hypothetical protein